MKHHSITPYLNFCVYLSVKIPFNNWSNLTHSLSSRLFWFFWGRGKEMSFTLEWMGRDKPKFLSSPSQRTNELTKLTEKHGWLRGTCNTRKSPGIFLVSYTSKKSHVQNILMKCSTTVFLVDWQRPQYPSLVSSVIAKHLQTYILLGRRVAIWAFWVLQTQFSLYEGMLNWAWSNDHFM